jgi:hypothetical protein
MCTSSPPVKQFAHRATCPTSTLRRARNAKDRTLRYETREIVCLNPALNSFNNLSITANAFCDKELARFKRFIDSVAIEMARQLQSNPRITQHNISFNARTKWTFRLSLMARSGRL